MTCDTCKRPMRAKGTSAPGTVQAMSKVRCQSCHCRAKRGLPGPIAQHENRDDVIEDAEFLARVGENVDAAARRLGYASTESLERSLLRWGRGDILGRFARLEQVAS